MNGWPPGLPAGRFPLAWLRRGGVSRSPGGAAEPARGWPGAAVVLLSSGGEDWHLLRSGKRHSWLSPAPRLLGRLEQARGPSRAGGALRLRVAGLGPFGAWRSRLALEPARRVPWARSGLGSSRRDRQRRKALPSLAESAVRFGSGCIRHKRPRPLGPRSQWPLRPLSWRGPGPRRPGQGLLRLGSGGSCIYVPYWVNSYYIILKGSNRHI